MQRVKIAVQGDGIAICLGYWEVIKIIKDLDPTTLLDQAYQGSGYIGFNLETGEIVGNPEPTTIKLYEIAKDNKLSLQELRNNLWQDWHRLQRVIEERVEYFYAQNYQIA